MSIFELTGSSRPGTVNWCKKIKFVFEADRENTAIHDGRRALVGWVWSTGKTRTRVHTHTHTHACALKTTAVTLYCTLTDVCAGLMGLVELPGLRSLSLFPCQRVVDHR